ncbi:MAG TPA: cell wall-active antibiotics response protein LiaF [Bacteroidota bacterium]|nr:cell wall-active antibiotics response protein LiaF [Bacteroidota bacterium]
MARSRGRWFGFVLIAVGIIFLLDSTGVIEFGEVLRTYWPLLLVLWGLWLLARGKRTERHPGAPAGGVAGAGAAAPGGAFMPAAPAAAGDSVQSSNVFGDLEIRVTSPSFRGGAVSTVFGDLNLDLSPGGLADGEHQLTMSGVFGDERLVLPRGGAVEVTAHTLAGDIVVPGQTREGFSVSLKYTSPGFDTAAKRLRVSVSQVFGDIHVIA